MTTHTLAILISGRGDDPNHRSHWAFAMYPPNQPLCTLYQVNLIGECLIYQFEERSGHPLDDRNAEGYFFLAHIKSGDYVKTKRILSQEPAPRNGRDRCQDWVLNCVVALETEEVVGEGTAELVHGLVGRGVDEVKGRVGGRWTGVGGEM